MDALMILLVFIVGFVISGLLFYGVAKLLYNKKHRDLKRNYISRMTAGNIKLKSGTFYSYK